MEDFFVQECCVHGTDLENHGPTSILCDDPLTNDPGLPDSPDRSDLAGGPLGWGGIKLSVRGLPFR